MKIDINADLGEGFGRWKMGDDEGLMRIISSANVACGYHAGDAVIMHRCVEMALANGVAVGAHCGLPDLLGFGRVAMDMDPTDLQKHVLYQVGALDGIARVQGARVTHASTHGILSEMGRNRPEYDDLILHAFARFNPEMVVGAIAGSSYETIAQRHGLRTVGKVFADRAYDDDGNLVSRKQPGAVIHDLEQVARRIEQFLNDGSFTTITGGRVNFRAARSIMIHSDTDGATEIAATVRGIIESGGGQIVPMTQLVD